MKKLTRDRVVPTISARTSCETSGELAVRGGLPVVGQQQERPCQPLLGGVQQLIDQVFFNADVPRQHVGQEVAGEAQARRGSAGPSRAVRRPGPCRGSSRSRWPSGVTGPPGIPPRRSAPPSTRATTTSFPACDRTDSRDHALLDIHDAGWQDRPGQRPSRSARTPPALSAWCSSRGPGPAWGSLRASPSEPDPMLIRPVGVRNRTDTPPAARENGMQESDHAIHHCRRLVGSVAAWLRERHGHRMRSSTSCWSSQSCCSWSVW